MRYFVEVMPPGEPGIRHEVSAGTGTLGTGPRDIVRLPGGSIVGPAALRLHVGSQGIEIGARDSACSFTYLGQSRKKALAKWGEEVYLGGTRLALVAEEGKKRGANPILIVLTIFVVLFAAGGVLRLTDPAFLRGQAPEPPKLGAREIPCGVSSPEAARVRAGELESLARAKEERYPFSRTDGVRALQLYQEAGSCFDKGGLFAERERAEAQLKAWSETVQRDFRDLRLRLDLALRNKDSTRAHSTARALESMISATPGAQETEYGRWLSRTKTRAFTEISRMEKGKAVKAKLKEK